MKNFIFIFCILVILFKTGNVLSNNNIFDVNNIEISKEIYKNKEQFINKAFKESFIKLINRLLLEKDYKKLKITNLEQVKKLVSYYQILDQGEKQNKDYNIKINVFFDKNRMHNFFYKENILYSDIINPEVTLFPLFKKNEKYFIYNQNYFYEKWNETKKDNLIQYNLLAENIENIEKINLYKDNIYNLEISDFFKGHEEDNIVFASIEINDNSADVFLNTRIEGKKISKNLTLKKDILNDKKFYKKIILEIDNVIRDLIKSQNLIDVRTPSFLNIKINLSNNSNLAVFNNRINNIDLIDNLYVQEINKDYVLVKIKYLGKIDKIMKKLKDQNINFKKVAGEWQINIIQ